HVPEIQMHRTYLQSAQALHQQQYHFDIAVHAAVTENLRSYLQRTARPPQPVGTRVQDGTDVTQPARRIARHAAGIDARHLRRQVGAYAHQASGNLIDELE